MATNWWATIQSGVITAGGAATLTNKTISADSNTITNIENADIKPGAVIQMNKLAVVAASRALESDSSGFVAASSVTSTELARVSGVTSAIQTQINSKAATSHAHAGEDITLGTVAAARLPINIDAAKIADASVTNAAFQYISGLTSNAQTQLINLQSTRSWYWMNNHSATANTVAYFAIGGAAGANATEANRRIAIDHDVTIKRIRCVTSVNGKNNTTVVGVRNGGATVASVSIATLYTGPTDSGALSVNIASGSLVDLIVDPTLCTDAGTLTIPLIIVEVWPTT